ncbi:MAG: GtrA family protein [Clostridia bacterium]|nr:GtrA family protein [Clostridia bacterium]
MNTFTKGINIYSKDHTLGQFLRYLIIGGLAAVVDISLFNIGVYLFHIHHILSNIISFTAGLTINYFLSRDWVFNKKQHQAGRDFALFALTGIIGVILSTLILFILVDLRILYDLLFFLNEDLIKATAKIIAVFLVLFWNFFARKKIVF